MWHVRHLPNFPALFPAVLLITLIYNDTQPSIFKTLHAGSQIKIVLFLILLGTDFLAFSMFLILRLGTDYDDWERNKSTTPTSKEANCP